MLQEKSGQGCRSVKRKTYDKSNTGDDKGVLELLRRELQMPSNQDNTPSSWVDKSNAWDTKYTHGL